jgi:AraC-like DNA-binding protein
MHSVGSAAKPKSYQSFAVGLEASPLILEHSGERYCLAIPLPPWAAYRLFQEAMIEVAEETVALEKMWGKDVDRLMEQLSELSSWSKRFSLVDRVLVEKFALSDCIIRPEIRWAWNQLELQDGCLSIRQSAQAIGWGNRHFTKCFREQIGVTPKAAARQIQFTQAHRLLTASDNHTLSEIALACGYSDQSHFYRRRVPMLIPFGRR